MNTTIILDCDPGIDDALAITFAAGHPGIELAGITTVAGNVGLPRTTRNALDVTDFVGAVDVPVTAGCAGPLLRPALDARHVHGATGLGGAVLPESRRDPRAGHASDFIIETLAAAPGEITLVATGPLTNIALALRKEPRIAAWAREFVIMGGSTGRGNVTPAAEYNMWADPEAAAVAFSAEWTVRMIGLDVTHQALATEPVRARLSSLGTLGSVLLLPALAEYSSLPGDPPVHDVCAVVAVVAPHIFGFKEASVAVETTGRLTSGMTVTEFAPSGPPNAQVAMSIDVDRFWDVVISAYGSIAGRLG
jgi:purine nucleosidase